MRLLIADDHDLVRETLATFLRAEGVEVDGGGSLSEALKKIEDGESYELILLDYCMPGMNGLDGLTEMKSASGVTPVAILSGVDAPGLAEAALRCGAAGYVSKTISPRALVAAVGLMAAGEVYVPAEVLNRPANNGAGLTARELDVLRGLCMGKSNKEIAMLYDLQEVTVKLHVKTLSRKLGAKNRTQAAMIGRDRSLI